jgi:hypothetical protein
MSENVQQVKTFIFENFLFGAEESALGNDLLLKNILFLQRINQ